MKKLLPYLLVFTIAINLFAPFAIHFGQRGLEVSKNEALATQINKFIVKQTSNTSDTITVEVNIEIEPPTFALSGYEVNGELTLKEFDDSRVVEFHELDLVKNGGVLINTKNTNGDEIFNGRIVFKNLKPATKYKLYSSLKYIVHASDFLGLQDEYDGTPSPNPITVRTFDVNDPSSGTTDNFQKQSANGNISLPSCHVLNGYGPGEGTIWGCLIQLEYWAVFQPTSWLFAWSGKFFDWAFGYSVQDSSYRSSFIVNGWSIVRDVCNLFFIFILIYAAFGLVLGLHSINSKKIIISVVLIGLLINFSLFTGQLLIDTSNILARLFYNPKLIEIVNKSSGNEAKRAGLALNQNTVLGEISLSAAIVNKVDPQQLILNAKNISFEGEEVTSGENDANLSTGTWFLIITLASIVNIIGIFVFISVGLIFIARVIGLWFALVLAPFAFFSYTVPQMQSISMLGWKKWWPDLLGLCFVAPLFMFFMYLILVFLEKGFTGLPLDEKGSNWALAVIVPFVFIMMLLMMAKKLAKDYSGEMGKMITSGVTAVGAAALGGAALGTAFLGRKVIGGTMARASRGETATQKYEAGTAKGLAKVTGLIGSTLGMGRVFGNTYDVKTKTVDNGLGGWLNKKQRSVADVDHARSDLDKAQEAAHLKGIPISQLSGENMTQIKKEFNKMKKGDVETSLRKGEDLKGNKITDSEDEFKSKKRGGLVSTAKTNPANIDPTTGELKDEVKKQIENDLNVQYNVHLKTETDKMLSGLFEHTREEAKGFDSKGNKVWQTDRIISKSNTGSYDVRNLSQSKIDSRAGVFSKIGVGLVAGVAAGVRMGLKGISGIEHGKGQGDFFKDLGHTITEAFKQVKINVDLKSGGGGHDDHGGGHDDHGHGGGGHH